MDEPIISESKDQQIPLKSVTPQITPIPTPPKQESLSKEQEEQITTLAKVYADSENAKVVKERDEKIASLEQQLANTSKVTKQKETTTSDIELIELKKKLDGFEQEAAAYKTKYTDDKVNSALDMYLKPYNPIDGTKLTTFLKMGVEFELQAYMGQDVVVVKDPTHNGIESAELYIKRVMSNPDVAHLLKPKSAEAQAGSALPQPFQEAISGQPNALNNVFGTPPIGTIRNSENMDIPVYADPSTEKVLKELQGM